MGAIQNSINAGIGSLAAFSVGKSVVDSTQAEIKARKQYEQLQTNQYQDFIDKSLTNISKNISSKFGPRKSAKMNDWLFSREGSKEVETFRNKIMSEAAATRATVKEKYGDKIFKDDSYKQTPEYIEGYQRKEENFANFENDMIRKANKATTQARESVRIRQNILSEHEQTLQQLKTQGVMINNPFIRDQIEKQLKGGE